MGSVGATIRDDDIGLNEQRTVIVTLDESYRDHEGKPLRMKLEWNTGKAAGPHSRPVRVRKFLGPGESYRLPIDRAQAYFGMFTLPRMMEDEYNEDRKARMEEDFRTEMRRAIMTWGEFPRGQATERGNGGQEIGPARIPPVILTVENADGSTEEPINLRELYNLGAFRYTPVRPTYMQQQHDAAHQTELEQLKEKYNELAASNAQMLGMLGGMQSFFKAFNITPEALAEATAKAGHKGAKE